MQKLIMAKKDKKLSFIGILFLILIFVIALNVFLYFKASKLQSIGIVEIEGFGSINISKEENIAFRPTEMIANCSKDEDCDWIITNCCREDTGAQWRCLNKNSYIDCQSKLVLCPNVSVPKPKEECKCINNTCEGLIFIVSR
jgi:hypothetical protein